MSSASSTERPVGVAALVRLRSRQLGMKRADLVQRLGYSNISKGLRRLDAILAGEVPSPDLHARMPAALRIDSKTYEAAVDETRRTILTASSAKATLAETEWRAAFRPHAIILTERRVPSPIFVALMIGVDRLLRIVLDEHESPLTFHAQALRLLQMKLDGGVVPCFGRPTGYVVNFTPDSAVVFDLRGEPIERLEAAYRLDKGSLRSGRSVGFAAALVL